MSVATRITLVILALLVAFIIYYRYDIPNVVHCIDPETPTVTIDISVARKGELIKREFLGWEWYWYTEGRER